MKVYNALAKIIVLNYSRDRIAHVIWSTPKNGSKEWGDDVPIRYSQESYIHDDNDVPIGGCEESFISLNSFAEELNSLNPDVSTSELLSNTFYTCTEALQNSESYI